MRRELAPEGCGARPSACFGLPERLPSAPPALCCVPRVKVMYHHFNPKNGEKAPLIADETYEVSGFAHCCSLFGAGPLRCLALLR